MTGTLQERSTAAGKKLFYVYLSYKEPNTGKWKIKTCSTGIEVKAGNKRKAEQKKSELVEKYNYLENPIDPAEEMGSDVRICDYLDYWLELKKSQVELSSTYQSYSYRVSLMKQYFAKDNPKVAEITAHTIDKYCRYLQTSGKRDQKTGKRTGLALRSVKDYKHIFSGVLSQAVVDGILRYNPSRDVKVRMNENCSTDSGNPDEYVFLNEQEISDMLHLVSEYYPKMFGIAFVAIYLGLRRSEILGLKISALDFDNHTLTVRHTVTRVKKATARDRTKTRKSYRTLSLFPTAEALFKQMISEKEENRLFYGNTYKESEYLFTWEDGHMYDPNYISRKFAAISKKFGRPEVTLHKLRHTCASLLIDKNWNPKKVQYWLGHEDIQTTLNIYAHYERSKMNDDYGNLEELATAVKELI